MIDYMSEHEKTFAESSFWKKNSLLLLMFYLHEAETKSIDLVFKIIRLWRVPIADIRIIKEDWRKIVQTIKQGRAHELSEGDTLYLGACTKGTTTAKSMRKQPFSDTPARGRAFSLKSKYLNFIIEQSLAKKYEVQTLTEEYERIIKEDEIDEELTFEEQVISKFSSHYGKNEEQLKVELALDYAPTSKSRYAQIARGIMGVKTAQVEEFEKADVAMKTIKLGQTGILKESMSFAGIKYDQILLEDWESSYLYETCTKRFFFVIFQRNESDKLCLIKAFFWTMPAGDLQKAEGFWIDTQSKVRNGVYDSFLSSTDHPICHVRPKARNAADTVLSPQGKQEKKFAYWLNRSYIFDIISE